MFKKTLQIYRRDRVLSPGEPYPTPQTYFSQYLAILKYDKIKAKNFL